ncbi:hypothetical protein Tco_1252956 [Tanacetum coccineum]
MAAVNNVPQLVDKKGGSYAAIAPKLKPRKINKWKKRTLCYLAGLRNANHTQALDLADIYRSTAVFTAFFSNNVIQDFQENSNDEVDERSKVSDDEEVTQVKVLIALADDELVVRKNHDRNGEWIDITMRKVNIILSMDEDSDWKYYLKYINIDLKFVEKNRLNLLSKYSKIVFELNKCRDELLVLKQASLDAVTFQIQDTELTKLNHALQEQLKEEKKINEKWLTISKKASQCISGQIPHQKKKVLGGEILTESSSKMNENENIFVPASMGYDHEMVPKTKDCVERLNPNSILPNFNTRRILVPESQAVNESPKPTKTSNTPESSKDSKTQSLIPLPPLKNL